MKHPTVNDQIAEVIAAHPELSLYGWKCFYPSGKCGYDNFESDRQRTASDDFACQVATAKEFIERYHNPVQKRRKGVGSYYLKHNAEKFGRDNGMSSYVSNGAFIVAAILLEMRIKRFRHSKNCGVFLALSKEGFEYGR